MVQEATIADLQKHGFELVSATGAHHLPHQDNR
jgi:predicted RNA binding protein YcfA (HicA-like mRNA interferase family)